MAAGVVLGLIAMTTALLAQPRPSGPDPDWPIHPPFPPTGPQSNYPGQPVPTGPNPNDPPPRPQFVGAVAVAVAESMSGRTA